MPLKSEWVFQSFIILGLFLMVYLKEKMTRKIVSNTSVFNFIVLCHLLENHYYFSMTDSCCTYLAFVQLNALYNVCLVPCACVLFESQFFGSKHGLWFDVDDTRSLSSSKTNKFQSKNVWNLFISKRVDFVRVGGHVTFFPAFWGCSLA